MSQNNTKFYIEGRWVKRAAAHLHDVVYPVDDRHKITLGAEH
jgi:hypothetical protein